MSMHSEIQKLSLSALIELFEIEIPSDPVTVFRFCTHKTTKNTSVVWNGVSYTRYPIRTEGFNRNSQGRLPRPNVTLSNVEGGISEFLLAYDDLIGSKVTRIRTLSKFLDAANFPGNVNSDADPTQEMPREVWVVDRKNTENSEFVVLELCSPFEKPNTLIPGRQILPICSNQYRDAECGYAGGPVATEKDIATSDSALDKCSKLISGCKLRFGANNELPFEGEPAIGLIR